MVLDELDHFPAFIFYYLQDNGMSKDFATNLVRNSCCPTLTVDIMECTWNAEAMTVTTKEDVEPRAAAFCARTGVAVNATALAVEARINRERRILTSL